MGPSKRLPAAGDVSWVAVSVPIAATILAVLPVMMVGTLAVEIRTDVGFSAVALGSLVATFSIAAALASMPMGRLVDRIGHCDGLILAGTLGGFSAIAAGVGATAWWHLAIAMAVSGIGVAAVHPAANVALATLVRERRRGLALGFKAAAVPAAIFFAGLAVPLLSTTASWRWAFAAVGTIALIVVLVDIVVLRGVEPLTRPRQRTRVAVGPLVLMTGVTFFGIAGGQAIATFLVEAAVAEGFSAAATGLVLSGASIPVIVVRIYSGWVADRVGARWALAIAGMLLLGGATGPGLLAGGGSYGLLVMGTFIGLGVGWSWIGLVHFAAIWHYDEAPATATSVVQIGTFGGFAFGPVAFGAVVTRFGYPQAWLAACGSMVVGGVFAMLAWRALAKPKPPPGLLVFADSEDSAFTPDVPPGRV